MFKIDSAGATVGNEFQDQDVGGGQQGTRVTADWLNAVQRELIAILTEAGITPSKAQNNQVVTAINTLIAAGGGGGGGGSDFWIDAVSNSGALPAGKPTGSIALSVSDLTLYRYTGSSWVKYFATADYAPATITKSYVGLGSVDNTADSAKPVSGPQATAIALKQSTSEKNQANGYAGLDGSTKIPVALLPAAVLGGNSYQGTFDPASGFPASPSKGYYYVSTGTATIGSDDYKPKDWAVYNGTTWDKIDNTDAVVSIDGMTGVVTLSGTYQALDADLTAISALATLGILKRTGVDTWATVTTLGYADGGTNATTQIGAVNNTGGLITQVVATTATLASGYWYLSNTTASAFSLTLPAGSAGMRIRVSDAKEKWDVNNLTINPQVGETIGPYGAGVGIICNVKRGWIDFAHDGATWAMSSLASTTSGVSSGGGLTPVAVSATGTSVANTMELCDVTSAAITRTLPVTTQAASIGFVDALENASATNFILVTAGGTDTIDNIGSGNSLALDYSKVSAIFHKAAGATSWKVQYQIASLPGGSGSGGLSPVAVTATVAAAVNNTMYLATSTAGLVINLPLVPSSGGVIGVMDAGETCSATNYIRIAPFSGQSINGYPVNDTMTLDYARANVVLYAAPGATSWKVQYQVAAAGGLATGSTIGTVAPRTAQTALTFSGTAAGWALVRAVGIYYQDQSGNHRLKFNIVASATASTGIGATIVGVTFKNITNYVQAVACVTTASAPGSAYAFQNTGQIVVQTNVAQPNYNVSGDVELEFKPTWA